MMAQRKAIQDRFANICNAYPPWLSLAEDVREAYIRRIERSCFITTINESISQGIDRLWTDSRFLNLYSMVCAKVMYNLDHTSCVNSTYLIESIIDGSIDPRGISDLTNQTLCPASSKVERETIELRQRQKITQKVSTAFICGKCGGNQTTFIKYQGRAADEDNTMKIQCVQCGHSWKKS